MGIIVLKTALYYVTGLGISELLNYSSSLLFLLFVLDEKCLLENVLKYLENNDYSLCDYTYSPVVGNGICFA